MFFWCGFIFAVCVRSFPMCGVLTESGVASSQRRWALHQASVASQCGVSRGRFDYCSREGSFVARMVSLSSCDVGCVCSKRQVGWRGRDKETAQRRRACLGSAWAAAAVRASFFNGRLLVVDIATQWIRWSVDRLTQGQDARGCVSRFTRRQVGAVGIKL